ncbi:MAG: 50S ribosomal protein L24 [Candidatus Aenigmarchaeota archaeon]|nr:50S ribosomal protein L24 [Candidatus Aenigmarchaeota archaeon]
MKIKKGDVVKILAGKDKNKKGKILRVLTKQNKVVVEGINLLVKHVRPRREGEKGQRVRFPAAISVSKVNLICPHCHQAIRISYRRLEDGTKKRYCRKCNELI